MTGWLVKPIEPEHAATVGPASLATLMRNTALRNERFECLDAAL